MSKQRKRVLNYMNDGGRLTSKRARILFGIMDFPKVISDIRKKHPDVVIKDKWKSGRNRFGEPVRFKEYWIDTDDS